MFDKLFVRVRSWLHSDQAGFNPGERAVGVGTGHPSHTPPPLPPDAWAESESGMVISESGIIIIDPQAAEAAGLSGPPPARPRTPPLGTSKDLPPDRAWALPSLPRQGVTVPPATPGNGNGNGNPIAGPAGARALSNEDGEWDEVLRRARDQIAAVPPGPGRTPAGSK
jgi:hypothetical protein